MSKRYKESEISAMVAASEASVCLGYCAASYLFRPLEKVGYTCGIYGWNYDVYSVHGVIACTGYRRMKGSYSPELSALTERYNRLAERLSGESWKDWKRYNRATNYILARWAREAKAIARKEGGKR